MPTLLQTLSFQQQEPDNNENPGHPYVLETKETLPVRSVPEQVAQEISLEDGESEITHIGARPFNGVIQGSLKNTHLHRILKDSDSTIDFIHNHVIHQR